MRLNIQEKKEVITQIFESEGFKLRLKREVSREVQLFVNRHRDEILSSLPDLTEFKIKGTVTGRLSSLPDLKNVKAENYARAGESWNYDEETQLKDEYQVGHSVQVMSQLHQRTPLAIIERLKVLTERNWI